MREIRNCLIEGRDDCQQLKPKGSHASFVTTMKAVTILLMLSILFGRVTVLFLYCPLCFFMQFFFCNVVHVRCSASGFCIISNWSVLMAVK